MLELHRNSYPIARPQVSHFIFMPYGELVFMVTGLAPSTVIFPLARIFPFTSSFSLGVFVPSPRFQSSELRNIFSVSYPPEPP